MLISSPGGVFPMVYSFPLNDTLQYKDRYRIEGGYDEPSQWIIQTKIAPVECRILSDNVASIYSNYFFDQVAAMHVVWFTLSCVRFFVSSIITICLLLTTASILWSCQ